jgi:hypothetical protein
MLKDLIKIANHLDKIGHSREANTIDLLIRKIASEDNFEMDLFNRAKKITYNELDSWIDRLESIYGDEESPYDQFDIDIEGEEWTVFYDPMNEKNSVAIKGYESLSRSNKRWAKIEKDFKYVCAKVKENFGGDDHNVAGGFGDYCNLMFKVGDQIYSMQPAYGGIPELELEILGVKVWGERADFEFSPEYMTVGEFAGVEWITYDWKS